MINLENFLSTKEAAKRLKVHKATILRWIKEGQIEAINVGRGYRLSEAALQAFITKRTTEVKQG